MLVERAHGVTLKLFHHSSLVAGGKFTSGETRRFLEFFAGGKRSFARARRVEAGSAEHGD